jgi:hypothetical protein
MRYPILPTWTRELSGLGSSIPAENLRADNYVFSSVDFFSLLGKKVPNPKWLLGDQHSEETTCTEVKSIII